MDKLSMFLMDIGEIPQIKRAQVWCHQCGHTDHVDYGKCFARGWPKHCGVTMSIDSPLERAALSEKGK